MKPKDQRPLSNQRACCANFDDVIEEYQAYHAKRDAVPVLREEEKERARVQREEAKIAERERIDEGKRVREEKKKKEDDAAERKLVNDTKKAEAIAAATEKQRVKDLAAEQKALNPNAPKRKKGAQNNDEGEEDIFEKIHGTV